MSKANSSNISKDSDIDAEVERYYAENEKMIDEAFSKYCFYDGNFEHQDQKKMFNDDRVFWEFVEGFMVKDLDKAAAILNQDMADKVREVITSIFPNSYVGVQASGPLGSKDVYVHFALGKNKDEWEHGIIHNDPLHTIFRIEGWDDDYQENHIEDAKSVKAKLLTGVRGVKFPSNKMSPESLIKKLGEYFNKVKEYHESQAKSTASIDADLPKLQKISDAFSHLNPEAGQYLASYLFYYAAHDHMVDIEDDMEIYEENVDNLPVLRSNNAQEFDKLQAQKIQEAANIAADLGEDAARCLNVMVYNNFDIYDGERNPAFSKFQKKMDSVAEGQQVDRQNSHNDSGYYDSKNSQYIVINNKESIAKLVQKHNKNTDRKEWAFVSSDGSKVLEWYGTQKPSEERVSKTEKRVQFFKHVNASTEDELAPGYLEQISKEISIEDVMKEGEPTETYVGDLSVTYGNRELSCVDKNGTLYIWVVDVINDRPNYSHYETIVNASTEDELAPGYLEQISKEISIEDVMKEGEPTETYVGDLSVTYGNRELSCVDKNGTLYIWVVDVINDRPNYSHYETIVNASTKASLPMNDYLITIELTTDATDEEVEEIASHCYTQLETLGDEYGRKHTPSEYRVKKLTHNTTASRPVSVKYWTIEQTVGTKSEYVESFKNNYIKTTNDIKDAIFFKTKKDAEKFKDDMIKMADGSEMKFETLKLVVAPHTFNKSFASTKVIAMNDVIKKAELINSKIGSVSGDWEKELEMKFSESADLDFESTYSNGNDSISLIDMYVFLKDKSLKVKLGIAGNTECETDEICGKLMSAEYSVDGKEFFPFTHFSEEYTNRKLEEGELLEAGEKALKDQEKLIKKQEKEDEKELKALKKEYEVKASTVEILWSKKLF